MDKKLLQEERHRIMAEIKEDLYPIKKKCFDLCKIEQELTGEKLPFFSSFLHMLFDDVQFLVENQYKIGYFLDALPARLKFVQKYVDSLGRKPD